MAVGQPDYRGRMATPDVPAGAIPDDAAVPQTQGTIRQRLAGWKRLATIAYRDPEHVAVRLTLFGSDRVGADAVERAERVQAQRPDVPRAVIAEEVRIQTAQVSRINGAVAGTPFLIALVPGYLAYLWQEGVMERRTAALYGHDPRALKTCAQILVLRGAYPTVELAHEELLKVRDTPLPDKPTKRRPIRVWVQSGYMMLVFGGFLSAPSSKKEREEHWKRKAFFGALIGGGIWLITWVLPVSFMIAMAWGCESHARSLGTHTLEYFGGKEEVQARDAAAGDDDGPGRTKRDVLRAALLLLSIAVPIGFIAYADHVRQSTGVNWLGALGALVAASVVIATTIFARRQ